MPIPIHGVSYATVAERLDLAHGGKDGRPGGIQSVATEFVTVGQTVLCQATITFQDGRSFKGTSEVPLNSTQPAERDAPFECAETSAWGRALAAAGYPGSDKGLAGAEEMQRPPRRPGPTPSAPAPNGVTGPRLDPATMRENARRALETDERELRANAVRVSPDVPRPPAGDDDPFAGLDASGPPAEWPTVTPGDASPKPEGYAQAVTDRATNAVTWSQPEPTDKQKETLYKLANRTHTRVPDGLNKAAASELIGRLMEQLPPRT